MCDWKSDVRLAAISDLPSISHQSPICLPTISHAINQYVGDEQWARVSVNGLWESIDREDGRTGPWCKGRWRVKSVDLERACDEYERERAAHDQAMVVAAQPSCYAISA